MDELAEWAAKELEGYAYSEEGEELPPYRRWHLTIRADVYNPYQAFVPDAEIPLKEKFRKAAIYHCFDGIGRLGRLLDKDTDGQLGAEHPDLSQ